jgi:hypothetical protein
LEVLPVALPPAPIIILVAGVTQPANAQPAPPPPPPAVEPPLPPPPIAITNIAVRPEGIEKVALEVYVWRKVKPAGIVVLNKGVPAYAVDALGTGNTDEPITLSPLR